ncbi:MAG: hypothetical protein KC621_15875 [Myxococcales bacterium]|nr:hypothetical protein [Myxococcales bacterium]
MSPAAPPRWSVTAAIGASLVVASACSLVALWGSSWSGAEDAVTTALADHLSTEAGLVAEHLAPLPVDVLLALGPGHAGDAVSGELSRLLDASGLHDAALLSPDGQVLGSDGSFLAAAAESDLVAQAAAGERVAGTLYEGRDGQWYLSGYAPLPGKPGWVVAVEGSATLGAVDAFARRQALGSVLVLGVVGIVATGLAAWVARPLHRLERDLLAVRPGDPPDRLPLGGPREVWRVTSAARDLLGAIEERDAEVAEAHRQRLAELTRLAAEVAHELRNPLNAVKLSVGRLVTLDDAGRREQIAVRLREQVAELDAIAARLVDLTRPLSPEPEPVDLLALVRGLASETELRLDATGTEEPVHLDPSLAREILRNLMLNARQAGASGVTVTREGSVLQIEDDGPGIEDPGPLFDWFHTTRARGSGLGLPISRRMAEAMGGRLECVRGRPATFRWTLA